MMKRAVHRAALLASGLAFALSMMGGATAAIADTAEQQDTPIISGDTDQLNTAELEILRSESPKYIQVDPYSGDITSVTLLTATELNELRAESAPGATKGMSTQAVSNYCNNSSLGCWSGYSPAIPLQFTVGTTNGTWGGRVDFYTGNYFAKLCWIDPQQSFPGGPQATFCMPERNGKNAVISLGMAVTGKQVNLSTTR